MSTEVKRNFSVRWSWTEINSIPNGVLFDAYNAPFYAESVIRYEIITDHALYFVTLIHSFRNGLEKSSHRIFFWIHCFDLTIDCFDKVKQTYGEGGCTSSNDYESFDAIPRCPRGRAQIWPWDHKFFASSIFSLQDECFVFFPAKDMLELKNFVLEEMITGFEWEWIFDFEWNHFSNIK